MWQRKEAAHGQVRAYSQESREHVRAPASGCLDLVGSLLSHPPGVRLQRCTCPLDPRSKTQGGGAEGGYNAREVARQRYPRHLLRGPLRRLVPRGVELARVLREGHGLPHTLRALLSRRLPGPCTLPELRRICRRARLRAKLRQETPPLAGDRPCESLRQGEEVLFNWYFPWLFATRGGASEDERATAGLRT